uniref:3-oxo-5-alpha-steroid 4-dehydrogenase C-terminal domain-containing protein n=1 Tax=Megaselia scalaris TaxID=36166 RepID=T1H1F3_MEGSC
MANIVKHMVDLVFACILSLPIICTSKFCELGNFSIHMTLRNLRPAGSKVRKIPVPDANPLSKLFNFVSCPNYTYEIGAWLCFSLMTKCFPALLFTAAGLIK